jgi:hypothetical protein
MIGFTRMKIEPAQQVRHAQVLRFIGHHIVKRRQMSFGRLQN